MYPCEHEDGGGDGDDGDSDGDDVPTLTLPGM